MCSSDLVGVLIAFPQLVTGSLDAKAEVNLDAIGQQMLQDLGQPGSGYGTSDGSGYGHESGGYGETPDTPDAQGGAESGAEGGYGSPGGYGQPASGD